jgi:hypothetical protein
VKIMESMAMNPRTLAALSAILLAIAGTAHAQRPQPPGQTPSFTLVNRTTSAIRELFATPAGSANWGQNRLDGRSGNPSLIPPGGSYAVRHRADNTCNFDLRVVFADGKSEEHRGVNVCATEQVTIGTAAAAVDTATGKPADDPSFRLFNRAAVPVTELYATPAGLGNWGQNRLGHQPLPPDNTRLLQLPRDGNCIYDLRMLFADKRSVERKRTNLCRIAELPVP